MRALSYLTSVAYACSKTHDFPVWLLPPCSEAAQFADKAAAKSFCQPFGWETRSCLAGVSEPRFECKAPLLDEVENGSTYVAVPGKGHLLSEESKFTSCEFQTTDQKLEKFSDAVKAEAACVNQGKVFQMGKTVIPNERKALWCTCTFKHLM